MSRSPGQGPLVPPEPHWRSTVGWLAGGGLLLGAAGGAEADEQEDAAGES